MTAVRIATHRSTDRTGEKIPLFRVHMPEEVMEPLREVLMSGYIGEGERVADFERALAPWVGSDNVLALNSCTSALQLALHLAGVGAGDEVVSTPLTCVATNLAILHRGARVVWADIEPATGNIDPTDVATKISPRTRAVMVVHWGGYPCDLEAIHGLASEHGLAVIEDAGHALGARHRGQPIGSHSHFVCFSFQAVKVLTTGDGGALTCRDPEDRERGRLLRWYGLDRETRRRAGIDNDTIDIQEAGYKFHMNDVCAAIGLAQLRHLGNILAAARFNTSRYDEAFSDLKTVVPTRRCPGRESSNWLYTVRVGDLPAFRSFLARKGIAVSQVHVRNDRYSVFRQSVTSLPGVDEFTSRHVCIPVGWWVTEEAIQHVIDAVREYDRRAGTTAAPDWG